MSEIDDLRRAFCDHFVKTGELDETLLARLSAFAVAHRGRIGDGRKRRPRRANGTFEKGLIIGKSSPLFIGPKRPRGRPRKVTHASISPVEDSRHDADECEAGAPDCGLASRRGPRDDRGEVHCRAPEGTTG